VFFERRRCLLSNSHPPEDFILWTPDTLIEHSKLCVDGGGRNAAIEKHKEEISALMAQHSLKAITRDPYFTGHA